MNPAFRLSLLSLPLAGLLAGCLDQGVQAPSSGPVPMSAGRNDSDPSKPGYDPEGGVPKVETTYERMLDHTPGYRDIKEYQARPAAKALAKAASVDRWVGVLPQFQSGWDACPPAQRVWIHQDDEDNSNESRTSEVRPWGATDADRANTTLYFCKVPGTALRRLYDWNHTDGQLSGNDFAVLKLDDQCPDGSKQFGLYVDNEDNRNANRNSGNIWPNVQAPSYTILYFCFFQTVGTDPYRGMPPMPYMGYDYAVFTPPNVPTYFFRQPAWVYSDDEDDGNKGHFILDGINQDERARIKRIIRQYYDKLGTTYNMATVYPFNMP